jgi:hypothetical protein
VTHAVEERRRRNRGDGGDRPVERAGELAAELRPRGVPTPTAASDPTPGRRMFTDVPMTALHSPGLASKPFPWLPPSSTSTAASQIPSRAELTCPRRGSVVAVV